MDRGTYSQPNRGFSSYGNGDRERRGGGRPRPNKRERNDHYSGSSGSSYYPETSSYITENRYRRPDTFYYENNTLPHRTTTQSRTYDKSATSTTSRHARATADLMPHKQEQNKIAAAAKPITTTATTTTPVKDIEQGKKILPSGPKSLTPGRIRGPPVPSRLRTQKPTATEPDSGDNEDDTLENLSKSKRPKRTAFMKYTNVNGSIHERIQQVGEGTYGKVYKARNTITGQLVALKRLRLESEREGFPITANREIGLLQSFDHTNIVGLDEMMVEQSLVYMVFPYMDHDLSGILQQSNIIISDGEKKNLARQLLKGIDYLHRKRVIHRDIKGSNILLDNNGVLKITDFGLARKMKNINSDIQSPNYTNRVITLWYRPPEILLGSTEYGREVDIWGIGCLLLELFTRHAVFQGTDEIDQLWKVYDIMGTITMDDWPDADKMPWFEMLRPNFHCVSKFKEKFGTILSPLCFDLSKLLLQMNPEKRISAHDALSHGYFSEEPKEVQLTFLKSVQGEWHEFEAKKKRRQQREEAKKREQETRNK